MKKKILSGLLSTILFIIALIYLYPLILVAINSLKTFSEITTNVVALPTKLRWDNYTKAFEILRYPHLFLNTLIATVIGTTGVVLLSSIGGYKLSRTKSKVSWIIFLACIAPMMIPFQSFMITLVKISKTLHLTGSTYGLGIIYWGLGAPLSLFMYHGFVKTIPKEMDECAVIDGCPPLMAFFKIILPLLKPITVSVVVLNVMWMWNDFLLPLLVLGGEKKAMTLQLGAYNFFGQYKIEWNYAMAAVFLTIIPAVILYLLLQKQIIKGMVSGAVKA